MNVLIHKEEANPQDRRRSQRVLLQVPILLRTGGAEQPSQVEALTLVVNAHGGLLEAPLRLDVDQKITLINPATGRLAECRVVRIDEQAGAVCRTAFEFDQPSPHFWPISFPPEDWRVTEDVTRDNS